MMAEGKCGASVLMWLTMRRRWSNHRYTDRNAEYADALLVAIVVGSTRPGRKARAVAQWVLAIAAARDDATFELVDLADFDLPLLDEDMPAAAGLYEQRHTRAWAAKTAPSTPTPS